MGRNKKDRYFRKLEREIQNHSEFEELTTDENYRNFTTTSTNETPIIREISYKKFQSCSDDTSIRFEFKEFSHNKGVQIMLELPQGSFLLERLLGRSFEFNNIIFHNMLYFKSNDFFLNLKFENCIFRGALYCSDDGGISNEANNRPFHLTGSLFFKNCIFYGPSFFKLQFLDLKHSLDVNNLTFENCAWLPQSHDGFIIRFSEIGNAERALFKDCYLGKGMFGLDKNPFAKHWSFLYCTFDSFFNSNALMINGSPDSELVFRGCKFLKGTLRSGADFYHKISYHSVERKNNIQAYEFYVLEEECKRLEVKDQIKGNLWWWIKYILSWRFLYFITSGYGSSVRRPLSFFFSVSILSVFLLYYFGEIKVNQEENLNFYHYLIAVFGRLVRTFGAFSEIRPSGILSETIVLLCNIFQSIFIILFFIALRRKFKVGY